MFSCLRPENGSIGYSSVSFSTGKYIGSWNEHQRVSRWEIFKKSIIFYSNNKTSILLVRLPDRILNVSNATPDPNEYFRCDPKIEFPCNGTDTCILKSWICDGRVSTFKLTLDVVFRQIEIILKDSTAFVYVTQSEKSSHFTLMTWFFTLRYINKGCGIF